MDCKDYTDNEKERENEMKKYEYSVRFYRGERLVGRSAGHYDTIEDALRLNEYCHPGETVSIVRREVGDWEELPK